MPGRRLVDPQVWSEAHDLLQEPKGEDAVVVYLYTLTCIHSNLLGVYKLPLSYIAEDLGWSVRRVQSAVALLQNRRLLFYDESSRVVFVPRLLQTQRIDGPMQLKRAIADVQNLPKTPLLQAVHAALMPRLSSGPSSKESAILWQKLSDLLSGKSSTETLASSPPSPSASPSPSLGHSNGRSAIRSVDRGEPSVDTEQVRANIKQMLREGSLRKSMP